MTMAERASHRRWDKENSVTFTFRFQNKGDADIIEFLKKHDNKTAVIKQLIRAEIAREEQI